MKRALSATAAAALVVAMAGVTTTAQAATQHCVDHTTEVKVEVPRGGTSQVVTIDGQLVTVTVDGDDVTFTDADGAPVSGSFCLKAGTTARNGSGESGSTGSSQGPGKDISYVVLYSVGGYVGPPS